MRGCVLLSSADVKKRDILCVDDVLWKIFVFVVAQFLNYYKKKPVKFTTDANFIVFTNFATTYRGLKLFKLCMPFFFHILRVVYGIRLARLFCIKHKSLVFLQKPFSDFSTNRLFYSNLHTSLCWMNRGLKTYFLAITNCYSVRIGYLNF